MAIEEQTVCDAGGRISVKNTKGKEAVKGTLCPVEGNPYQFYAGIPSDGAVPANLVIHVQMILPVGGPTSGLYRFPRVGERVLVEHGERGSYLLGYVPQDTEGGMPFTSEAPASNDSKAELLGREQAMLFRYKDTPPPAAEDTKAAEDADTEDTKDAEDADAENAAVEDAAAKDEAAAAVSSYSEIGFYQRGYGTHLGIYSTGSTEITTAGRQYIWADGVEILSGLNPVTVNDNPDDNQAVGDCPGEVYELGNNDIQIRAGGKIFIKAADSIVLQVGRSKIALDEIGINLISKKVNSNWLNTFDTTVNLNARTGISMFGQTVNIAGGRSVNMADSYGGSFGASAGEAHVAGREVAIDTHDSVGYVSILALNGLDYGFNTATVALARKGTDPSKASRYVNLAREVTKKISKAFFSFIKVRRKYEQMNAQEREEREERAREEAARIRANMAPTETDLNNLEAHLTRNHLTENPFETNWGDIGHILGEIAQYGDPADEEVARMASNFAREANDFLCYYGRLTQEEQIRRTAAMYDLSNNIRIAYDNSSQGRGARLASLTNRLLNATLASANMQPGRWTNNDTERTTRYPQWNP